MVSKKERVKGTYQEENKMKDNSERNWMIFSGIVFGMIFGFISANYFPFVGGIWVSLCQPFSPCRMALVSDHMVLCGLIGGAIGYFIGTSKD